MIAMPGTTSHDRPTSSEKPAHRTIQPPVGAGSHAAPDTEWRQLALCAQTNPEEFFAEIGGSTRIAKQICGACEVKSAIRSLHRTHVPVRRTFSVALFRRVEAAQHTEPANPGGRHGDRGG